MGGVHQLGMGGLSAVFVYQQFHQFAFPGELVLFADDFQEGDGVGDAEGGLFDPLGLGLVAHGLGNAVVELGDGLFAAGAC